MSAEDAQFAARRAFGNPTAAREHFREHRPGWTLESIGQDVRYGLRAMRRNPAFTVIAVTSLALGIGANTTMFSVIDAILLKTPAHVQDAARITASTSRCLARTASRSHGRRRATRST